MPYIAQEDRPLLDKLALTLASALHEPKLAGKLNYTITSLIDHLYLNRPFGYTELNTIVGVLECVKLELYRRVGAPYEDEKKKENGDVYENLSPEP